jgi:methylthioribose-1-phosphate isomerase
MQPPWGERPALSGASYSAAEIAEGGDTVWLLDQLLLPKQLHYRSYTTWQGVAEGIREMVVRGAPAIGVAAAYAMTLAASSSANCTGEAFVAEMKAASAGLLATRPTAVNLAWAVDQCIERSMAVATQPGAQRLRALRDLALSIHRDDVAACQAMGRVGAARLKDGMTVLTHCNAGALATGGYGTALGVIRAAVAAGKQIRVLASETRPYLQGARLTSWELHEDGIDVTVISDNMVAHCMQKGMVDAVVVGADRIAANGDVANKIGTYGIACLAKQHALPMYVAAPWSTVDLATPSGAEIAIEQRPRNELTELGARLLVAEGIAVYNPAFDVTPAGLIQAIFCERGELEPACLPV